MNRRGFLGTILAAAVAPAIVRAQSLMPGRALAPSSTEAIVQQALAGLDFNFNMVEGHVLDALRYGIGAIELHSAEGGLLARLPFDKIQSRFEGAVIQPGRIDMAVLRTEHGSSRFTPAYLDIPDEATSVTCSPDALLAMMRP